ncbi:Sensory transduction histidine kinase [Magnetospirillum sp. LM-5]|uniref:PAS domain-containing sensor histidine kinase n=1 Tax=Magnetospirillum sp. LM-5 TaxID=2681466 RepID=UPI00137E981A|nr:PAS domain-containing sensor histidine kinase [Magnetospirillum sp. LM-5]CAA7625763.1 Sensory transduction histidine kinase [Magnetospirillum sp. LM-5]
MSQCGPRHGKPPRTTGAPSRAITRLRDRVSQLEQARAELQAAKTALQQSEERYALAMRGPNEGLWDWNPVTKELYLSARLLTILGFGSDNVRTTSNEWLEIVHPEDRGRYQSDLVRHLKGLDEHFECEYRVRDRAGTYRWMLARGLAVRGADGIATRMVGSIGDITERKQRESILRASEARFRSLVEAAASVIVVIDGTGLLREFNREAERVFNVRRDAVVDQPWNDVLTMTGGDFGALLAAVRRGHSVREQELTTADGTVLSWNLALLDDGAGIIGVAQDVTRRHWAEKSLSYVNESLERRVAERTRELERAREEAEQASKAKSDFVANMSHELRTPLNAIIGFSDVMRLGVMGPLGNSHYSDYVEAIWDSGTHLLSLINDILDMAKIEAGEFVVRREPVNPVYILHSACRLVRDKARAHEVTMKLAVHDDIGTVELDPLRFRQIILILASNALKFTPNGGEVEVVLRRDDDFLHLSIADSGIGMTPDEIAQAMRPFVQVDSSLARRFQGTGLGLPLTQKFVDMHGGTLSIESCPGTGTKVTVVLPVKDSAIVGV